MVEHAKPPLHQLMPFNLSPSCLQLRKRCFFSFFNFFDLGQEFAHVKRFTRFNSNEGLNSLSHLHSQQQIQAKSSSYSQIKMPVIVFVFVAAKGLDMTRHVYLQCLNDFRASPCVSVFEKFHLIFWAPSLLVQFINNKQKNS